MQNRILLRSRYSFKAQIQLAGAFLITVIIILGIRRILSAARVFLPFLLFAGFLGWLVGKGFLQRYYRLKLYTDKLEAIPLLSGKTMIYRYAELKGIREFVKKGIRVFEVVRGNKPVIIIREDHYSNYDILKREIQARVG